MKTLEMRYEEALRKIGTEKLLHLPEPIKDVLRSTTDLQTKVKILEEIAEKQ